MQILVADDDAAIRDLLGRGLRGDFNVLLAIDGNAALTALETLRPDAMLVDEMMPGATGTQVLLRAKELWPEVPRLLMTASSDVTAAMRAVNRGEVHRFYTKPLRLAEIRRALIELVSRARADAALRVELLALRAVQSVKDPPSRVAILCEGEIGERLERAARRRGFSVVRALRKEALEEVIGAGGCDVVVVDVDVGDQDLAEITQLVRRVDVGTSLILVDATGSVASLTKAFQFGAVDCLMPPWLDDVMLSVRLERAAARPRERSELRRLTHDLVAANRELAIANRRVEEGQVKLLGGLVRALEARDPYTAGHTDRVATISVRCGAAMGLGTVALETIRVGALLHDIGKIGIRDDTLYKPGRLTPAEYEAIKAHTTIGARILEGIESLACVVPIVRGHHERPDGRGYPDGVFATDLPLEVRIVSGADVLDAITSTRPYRPASGVDEAFEVLATLAGGQLDADVVNALRGLHREGRIDDLLQHDQ
jgi:putative two-component system response regulator